MRLLRVCALAGAIALLACAPARGSDHLMRINEVGLSAGGSTAAQYVELRDSVTEPFIVAPYRVVVYSAAGARLGAQTLTGTFGTSPFLVSTATADEAFGVAANQRLGVALPAAAGQVCFTRGLAEMRIHCLAYGAVAPTLSSEGGSQTGPAPPNCMALERTGSGSYVVAGPTPKAGNDGSTPGTTCRPPPDTDPPGLRLRLRRRPDVDRIVVRVRVDEAADLELGGFARVAGTSRRLRFRTIRREVEANQLTRVVLKLRSPRRRLVKEALADDTRVAARVTVEAEDPSGNSAVSRRRLVLTN